MEKFKNEFMRVISGLVVFVETVSLLVISSFALWGVYNLQMRGEYKKVLLFAALVIGLRGAYEFLRHIRKLGSD